MECQVGVDTAVRACARCESDGVGAEEEGAERESG